MNVFARIGNVLHTPKLTDSILPGITRDALIKLARQMKIKVVEKNLSVQSLVNACAAGQQVEFFGCGTATVVVPFQSFTFNDKKYLLKYDKDAYALRLKKRLVDIQYGVAPDEFNWVVNIKS